MKKSILYIKHSQIAQEDDDYILNKHKELLQNSNNRFVLDVGCGPGNITYNNILPLLPKTMEKLIGVDYFLENVEHANKYYQNDPRISYEQMDIRTEKLPSKYVNNFDLILSLYCIHFVGDHKKAFSNFYNMMKPSGRLLVTFSKTLFTTDLYKFLYNMPKWKKYMHNIDDVAFKIQPLEYYKALLEGIGFRDITCTEEKKFGLVSEEDVIGLYSSLNLFKVPEDLEEEFFQNHLDYYKLNSAVTIDAEGKKRFQYLYYCTVFTASK